MAFGEISPVFMGGGLSLNRHDIIRFSYPSLRKSWSVTFGSCFSGEIGGFSGHGKTRCGAECRWFDTFGFG